MCGCVCMCSSAHVPCGCACRGPYSWISICGCTFIFAYGVVTEFPSLFNVAILIHVNSFLVYTISMSYLISALFLFQARVFARQNTGFIVLKKKPFNFDEMTRIVLDEVSTLRCSINMKLLNRCKNHACVVFFIMCSGSENLNQIWCIHMLLC